MNSDWKVSWWIDLVAVLLAVGGIASDSLLEIGDPNIGGGIMRILSIALGVLALVYPAWRQWNR